MVEEPGFGVEPTGEPDEGAGRADHTVTRHDDRDRVASVRRSDRTSFAAVTEARRLLAVADRLAVRDRSQRGPRSLLEVGADRIERDIERGPFAVEVLGELIGRSLDDRFGRLVGDRLVRGSASLRA